MRKTAFSKNNAVWFKQWSRKSYALFLKMNKVVHIGHLKSAISELLNLKSNVLARFELRFTQKNCFAFFRNNNNELKNLFGTQQCSALFCSKQCSVLLYVTSSFAKNNFQNT